MSDTELELDFEELSSAEDFLEHFDVEFDAKVVHVYRLHMLQRFHDYIQEQGDLPSDDQNRFSLCRELLIKAYNDFVVSDAQTEKVFKVFHMHEPQTVYVPLHSLRSPPKRSL